MIDDASANLILTTKPILENIQGKYSQSFNELNLSRLQWVTTETIEDSLASEWQPPNLSLEQLAFLQYTSGSTGNPKGVMVSHGNILHNQSLIKKAFGHSDKTVFVGWLPLFHDMGLIGNMLQPLYLGIPSILMPPVAFLQKPINWLKAISQYGATTSGGPNSGYDLCLRKIKPDQCEGLDLSRWDVAFNGAEPLHPETIKQFSEKFAPYGFRQEAFYPCYGMAETTLFIAGSHKSKLPIFQPVRETALQKNQIEILETESKDSKTLVGCGQNFFEKMKIVDPQTQIECQDDQVGEIWVAGSSVAQGYWNREELSQEMFQAHLADTQEGPFLRTGDLGFIDNGEVFITGRLKDVIIIRGRNYYPQDIELTVEQCHPALRPSSGAAFAIEESSGEKLIVVQEVERTYLRKLNKEEVFAAIRRTISEGYELQVSGIVLIKTASVPKTSSGKIQRHACAKGYLEESLSTIAVWKAKETGANVVPLVGNTPTKLTNVKEIQQWMINWLAKTLQLTPQEIDPQRPFADYGLDSVMAVDFAEQLGTGLGREIDMTLAWSFPSIASAAANLANPSGSSKSKAKPKKSAEEKSSQQAEELAAAAQFLEGMSEQEMAEMLNQELANLE